MENVAILWYYLGFICLYIFSLSQRDNFFDMAKWTVCLFLLSQSHHTGHTYCTCADQSACTYTLATKAEQTHTHFETHTFRAVIPDAFKNLGRLPKKIISCTRKFLNLILFNSYQDTVNREAKKSHSLKCTICIIFGNIWHIFENQHDEEILVLAVTDANAERQAQLANILVILNI